MSDPNCIKCKVLLTEENRIPLRNICDSCNYKQQKEINENKHIGETEQTCETCGISKPFKKFSSKGHHICRQCSEEIQTSSTEDKYCTKCNVLLTQENRSPRTCQCRDCVNKRKREAKAKKEK